MIREKEVCEKTHNATPREKLVADAEAGGDTLLAELWRVPSGGCRFAQKSF